MTVRSRCPNFSGVTWHRQRLQRRRFSHDETSREEPQIMDEHQTISTATENLVHHATGTSPIRADRVGPAAGVASNPQCPNRVVMCIEDVDTPSHTDIPDSHSAVCRTADANGAIIAHSQRPDILGMPPQTPQPGSTPRIPTPHHARCGSANEKGGISRRCQRPHRSTTRAAFSATRILGTSTFTVGVRRDKKLWNILSST
mmetsp:Transcript_9607/g.15546  ORF Transcript_9607/g.15546 Transcript_9607/m.15546 type:complete len:201 (-) Transcript_9607:275-877(-)